MPASSTNALCRSWGRSRKTSLPLFNLENKIYTTSVSNKQIYEILCFIANDLLSVIPVCLCNKNLPIKNNK
jgi:hypothetical protein